MEVKENFQLSGTTHDENFFRYYSSREIEFAQILKVLKGELLGCIFKDVMSSTFINTIYHNAFGNKTAIKEKLEKEEQTKLLRFQ